jgi:hypothetical protein
LQGIVKAGIGVWMFVTFGMPNDAMIGVDNGKIRWDADAFQILGDDADKDVVAIGRRMWQGMMSRRSDRISRPALREFILKHHDAIHFAKRWVRCQGGNATVCAVVGRAWYTADRDRLTEFMECLKSGVNHGEKDRAAITLLNVYRRDAARFVSGAGRVELYRKVEAALSAFLEGRPITKVYEVDIERFPIPGDGEE